MPERRFKCKGEGGSHENLWENSIPGRRKNQCKGLKMGAGPIC